MKKLHCIYIAPSYTPPYTYLVEIPLGPTSDISNLMVFPTKYCSPPEHLHAYKHVYIESARRCDCPVPGDLARSGATVPGPASRVIWNIFIFDQLINIFLGTGNMPCAP